jgi:hypothetical protein
MAGEQSYFHAGRYSTSLVTVGQGKLVSSVSLNTPTSDRVRLKYLENEPHACPRQSDMDRVNVCYSISDRLELVDESYQLISLVLDVHLTTTVLPAPILDSALRLELSSLTTRFFQCYINHNSVWG